MTCHRCGARADRLTTVTVTFDAYEHIPRYVEIDLCAACVEGVKDSVKCREVVRIPPDRWRCEKDGEIFEGRKPEWHTVGETVCEGPFVAYRGEGTT